MSAPDTIFCVGPSTLARDISDALGSKLRVRWAANSETLLRSLRLDFRQVAACIVESTTETVATLASIRRIAPTIRRFVATDSCDLALVRAVLESQHADEILYRPFDPMAILMSIRPPASVPATQHFTTAHRQAAGSRG